jgi:hypothetical protein
MGKLSGFSIERLMRLLLVLGRDIEITAKRKIHAGINCEAPRCVIV